MNPNKTITSEKYKQQALNSLDSSYGIILKNGAFMLDDNFTLVFLGSVSNFKNKYISDKKNTGTDDRTGRLISSRKTFFAHTPFQSNISRNIFFSYTINKKKCSRLDR